MEKFNKNLSFRKGDSCDINSLELCRIQSIENCKIYTNKKKKPKPEDEDTNIGEDDLIFLALCTPRFQEEYYVEIND